MNYFQESQHLMELDLTEEPNNQALAKLIKLETSVTPKHRLLIETGFIL